MRIIGIVLGVAAALFAATLLLGWSYNQRPGADEEMRMRRGIEYCWEQQGKKSLDPATARFAARSCEGMEDEFVRKYGRKP